MRWLFQFRIGGEEKIHGISGAHGLGHASRCLSVIEQFKKKYQGEAFVIVNPFQIAKDFLKEKNIEFLFENEITDAFNKFKPTLIFVDINYLGYSTIQSYRKVAPVVNLAPRGLTKYYADATFVDLVSKDVYPPKGFSKGEFYQGPQYAVVSEAFRQSRNETEEGRVLRQNRQIVIAMGGIDFFDLTSDAVKGLDGLNPSFIIKIIIGKSYPHEEKLRKNLRSLNNPVKIMRSPDNISQIICESEFGIFGAGLLSYEALLLGVPHFNIALSDFHLMRSHELSGLGVAFVGGRHHEIKSGSFVKTIEELFDDPDRLNQMRRMAMRLVDGKGVKRIVDRCVELFEQKD